MKIKISKLKKMLMKTKNENGLENVKSCLVFKQIILFLKFDGRGIV